MTEPTQFGDNVAAEMRAYFEAHKKDRWHEGTADNLMLGLLNIALAEYAPEREPMRWQPIETAPKDGTEILILAHGMTIQARYCPGGWSEDTPVNPAEYSGAIWCAFDDAVQFEIEETPEGDFHGPATHWMPLPAPPTAQSEKVK